MLKLRDHSGQANLREGKETLRSITFPNEENVFPRMFFPKIWLQSTSEAISEVILFAWYQYMQRQGRKTGTCAHSCPNFNTLMRVCVCWLKCLGSSLCLY